MAVAVWIGSHLPMATNTTGPQGGGLRPSGWAAPRSRLFSHTPSCRLSPLSLALAARPLSLALSYYVVYFMLFTRASALYLVSILCLVLRLTIN